MERLIEFREITIGQLLDILAIFPLSLNEGRKKMREMGTRFGYDDKKMVRLCSVAKLLKEVAHD